MSCGCQHAGGAVKYSAHYVQETMATRFDLWRITASVQWKLTTAACRWYVVSMKCTFVSAGGRCGDPGASRASVSSLDKHVGAL